MLAFHFICAGPVLHYALQICIGPVCLPVWQLFPLLLLFLSRFWGWIKARVTGVQPPSTSTAAVSEDPADAEFKVKDAVDDVAFAALLESEELLVVDFHAAW